MGFPWGVGVETRARVPRSVSGDHSWLAHRSLFALELFPPFDVFAVAFGVVAGIIGSGVGESIEMHGEGGAAGREMLGERKAEMVSGGRGGCGGGR